MSEPCNPATRFQTAGIMVKRAEPEDMYEVVCVSEIILYSILKRPLCCHMALH